MGGYGSSDMMIKNTSSSKPSLTQHKMGRLFLVELDIVPGQGTEHYRCRKCFFEDLTADTLYIALKNKCVHEEFLSDRKYAMITLITRARRGKLGENHKPAHFFSEVVNVAIGKPVVQDYLGKPGIMANVYCNNCNMHLGWKIHKMGRPFLVEFDIVPGNVTEHLRCNHCYPAQIRDVDITYVALKKNRVIEKLMNGGRYRTCTRDPDNNCIMCINYTRVHFYKEVANVAFGEPVVQPFIDMHRGIKADMYCNRCNTFIGWKFIESFVPKYKFLEGLYAFDRLKLDLWADENHQGRELVGMRYVCA